MASLAWVLVVGSAAAWPPDAWWQPLERSGAPLEDVAGDVGSGAVDILGDSTTSAAAWSADADNVYLGLRVSGPAYEGGAFLQGHWGALWDVDQDEEIDFAVMVGGSGGDVQVHIADPATTLLSFVSAGAVAVGGQNSGVSRVRDLGDGGVWVEWSVPRDMLFDSSVVGIGNRVNAVSQISLAFATYDGIWTGDWSEVLGCDGVAACGPFLDVRADGVTTDRDGDGATDPEELAELTDPDNPDTDDDGLLDGNDPGPLTCDADGDGIWDSVEAHLLVPEVADSEPVCFRYPEGPECVEETEPGVEPIGLDPTDADSDDGGLDDGFEDRNKNGTQDAWETNPCDPTDDLDSDGDTIPDIIEGTGDYDGDGVADMLDLDADQDGLLDIHEGVSDIDGDGQPAFRDEDSDGDTIADGADGLSDRDGDGLPAYLDEDSDGDGIGDVVEGLDDFDGDGTANYLDRDADDDGRNDQDEGVVDLDCDGEPDYLDVGIDDGFCDSDLPVGTIDTSPFGGQEDDVTAAPKAVFTGGACASLGGAGATAWLLALGVVPARRRRAWSASASWLVLAIVLSAAPQPAEAASVSAYRFRPTVDGWRFLVVEDALLARPAQFGAGILVDHTRDPLVFRRLDGEDDERYAVLGGLTTTHLSMHATPSWRFRLGMSLPVHFGLYGDDWSAPGALGDLRLGAKVGILRRTEALPLDLAAVVDLELPTGAGDLYVGHQRTVAQVGVAVRGDPIQRLALVAEIGVRTGTTAELGELLVGPELAYGLGANVHLNKRLWLGAELDGTWSFRNGTAPGAAPAEVLGTLRGHLGRDVVVTVGGGAGVTRGVGAPAWRALVGVSWLPGFAGGGVLETVVEEPPTPSSRVVVRVIGPRGESIQGALVEIQNTGISGETDMEGTWGSPLEPGEYFVSVGFAGRTAEYRSFELRADGLADVTVVLLDEARPTPDSPDAEQARPGAPAAE